MPNLTLRATRDDGAVVEIAIAPSDGRARAIAEAGLPPVLPQVVFGLIDTGAGITMVDEAVIAQLSLVPIGEINVRSTAAGAESRMLLTFDVRLEFVAPERRLISTNFPVAGGILPRSGLGALIGRDILSRCLLIYNGPMNQFIFSY